jgi:D-xylulose kinase
VPKNLGFDGLYVGIDCGTQGLKALLLDGASGRIVAMARRAYGVIPTKRAGVSEQDPRVWIAAAKATIREVAAKAGARAKRIVGIAVSGQQHGLVALDAAGRVLRPAKLWNDVSTAREAREIVERVGGAAAMRAATGNALPPGFTASKVLWFSRAHPDLWDRCATVCLPHDYLNLWLSGERAAEAGDASGTGYFDVRARRYAKKVMDAIDPDLAARVPPLREAGSALGEVPAARAKELGLPRGVLVGAGGGDNMMAALGTGATREGIVTVSLGTSGTVFAHSRRAVVDPRGEMAAFCDSTGGHLPLFCIQNCTNTTEIFKGILGFDDDALDAAARHAPAGCGGALLLPFFGGERTPNLPGATAAIVGISSGGARREILARLAMEGPTLGLADCLDRLRALGVEPAEVRLTGGGARSRAWRQMCADAFGAPVSTLAVDEGAALGAAIDALWCAAKAKNPRLTADAAARPFVRASRAADPDPKNREIYRDALGRRRAAIDRLFGESQLSPRRAAARARR